MKIFKFGGASVKDAEGVKNVALVLESQGFENCLLVVSAMGKTTNALEKVVENYFAKQDYQTEIEKVNKVYLAQLVAISRSGAAGKKEVENLMPYFNHLNANFYHIINSYDERTPHIIILLLLVSSWLIGILVGFMNAFHERRHFLVPFIFVVLVSGSIQCIRDLDNPYEGIIQPNFNDFANQREALIQHIR